MRFGAAVDARPHCRRVAPGKLTAAQRPPVISPSALPALAPFKVRAFRFQWPSDLLVSFALEMETLILGWYILVETRSVVLLTAFAGLQFLGGLVAPLVGVLGDRMGRRRLLYAIRFVLALLAMVLMVLGLSDALSPAAVFAVALLAGLVRPSDLMLRLALVTDMMPPDRLMSAMGLSRITLDIARVFGALAGAGLFAWLGFGVSYIFVACFYLAGFGLMLGATRGAATPDRGGSQPHAAGTVAGGSDANPLPAQSGWRDLKDGVAYVRRTPRLMAIFWLAVLVNLVGFPLTAGLLPYLAKEIYQLNEIGYGHLVATHALGALSGSMLMTFLMRAGNASRIMLAAAVLWHAAIVVLALVNAHLPGLAALFVVGAFQSMTMVTLATALLGAAAEQFRGRVMGVRMLAVYGLPLGLLACGFLIKVIGFVATITTCGALGIAGALLIGRRWRNALWQK